MNVNDGQVYIVIYRYLLSYPISDYRQHYCSTRDVVFAIL